MRHMPGIYLAMLISSIFVVADCGQAADLVIHYGPPESRPAPLPEQGASIAVLLDPVIVTAQPKTEIDESFKRAKDRIAAFGRRRTKDKGLLGALGF